MAREQELILEFYLCLGCGNRVGLHEPVKLLRCGNCSMDMKNILDFDHKDLHTYYSNPRIAARNPEIAAKFAAQFAPKPNYKSNTMKQEKVHRLHFQDLFDAELHHLLNQDLDKQNVLPQGRWAGQSFEYSDFERWIAVHALPASATRLLGGVRYLRIVQNIQREGF